MRGRKEPYCISPEREKLSRE